jgi:PAS domain S-box-containing protein
MSAADLNVRVDHVTRAEVGATAQAFDTMAERLEAFYLSLKQSEQRYQTLAEVSPVGIFNTDAEGSCIYVNERYSEITGLPRERFYGKSWVETLCLTDRERVEKTWYACVKQGKPFAEEYRILTSRGSRLWVYVQAIRVETESGRGGYVGTMTDITRLKNVEQELARHRDKLEERVEERTRELASAQTQLLQKERLATLGQVTATVSHELRNPLGVISNATYYLKRILSNGMPEKGEQAWQKTSEKFIQYLDMIEREVMAANRIIADLLATSRTKEPMRQLVNLDELIDTVMVGEHLPAGIDWEYIRNPHPFMLKADPQQLRQVLYNLITNAVQALDGSGHIRLVAQARDNGWQLCLSDSGPGINMASREQVFEPLYTTKAKGNGLGLWISREIAQRHGGCLQLADSVLGGATFCLWLPIETAGDKHENEVISISCLP